MNELNELQLIKKYLDKVGFRISDITYFDETFTFIAAGTQEIGQAQGFNVGHQFFFGNISIDDSVTGVVVLANKNLHTIYFNTLFYSGIVRESARVSMGVNLGMSLLGDGVYQGCKRLYGVGCNRVVIGQFGCGASTLTCTINLNGYMFTSI